MSRFEETRPVERERIREIQFQLYSPGELVSWTSARYALARAVTDCPQQNCSGEGEFIYGAYSNDPQNHVFNKNILRSSIFRSMVRSRHPLNMNYEYITDETYCSKCGICYAATVRQNELIISSMVEYLQSHGMTVVDE